MNRYRKANCRSPRNSAEAGLSLLEVIVAIAILTIVATASATLSLTGIAAAATQERLQVAVTVASSNMEIITATPVTDLYTGRWATNVSTAWTASSTAVGVGQTYQKSDPAGSSSSAETIPIHPTVPPQAGTTYTVTTLLGACYQKITGGDCGKITGQAVAPAVPPAGYTDLVRAIVIVKWFAGKTCASGCTYVATTLIDPSTNLTWVSHG
ncbi:MAG: type II secretion system protein [Rhodoglobus sp.]